MPFECGSNCRQLAMLAAGLMLRLLLRQLLRLSGMPRQCQGNRYRYTKILNNFGEQFKIFHGTKFNLRAEKNKNKQVELESYLQVLAAQNTL